jgi:GTP-binding protein HflX
MTREAQDTIHYPKTLLIGIEAPYNTTKDIDSYFEEFKNLAKTNHVEFEDFITIRIREIDTATFITKGKLEQIKKICEEKEIKQIIISEPLTVKQERNLNDFLNCKVFDRTQLILEIFEKAAISAEGKFQVEIAMLQHLKGRIAGKGRYLSQQVGIIGTRGPGETAKEKAIRHIDEQIHRQKKKLEKMHQARETQRKKRITNQIPHICLIGYTNAGKSTILNTLTKSEVIAANRPFSTLDTTTRELYINKKKKGIISDTVGFIQLLPPQLIEAFKSTLSELQYANLLLHVVDISDKNWESQIRVVLEILHELDVHSQMLYVFNKSDKATNMEELQDKMKKYQPNVIVSAISHKGIEPLIEYLDSWEITTVIPPLAS